VLTGAAAVFWNPGGVAAGAGTVPEAWVAHVDGPDATGVRGVAVAVVTELPMGFRGGFGFWHLGVEDIPRTTTSPEPEPGSIGVSEDAGFLVLARDINPYSGAGASLRIQRGTVAGDSKVGVRGEVGAHLRPPLPLNPRIGLSLGGLGGDVNTMGAVEASPPPLADGRVPLCLAYGLRFDWGDAPLEQRFSLRGSWMGQFHLGLGLSHVERDGWTPLWMLGADIGRYSLAILRESLPNGFGPVHYYRAAVRFP
jgi:hypothetical protein